MFNFQGSELIIIVLLALVVLGPEKLPDAMRRMGRFYADLKKMSSSFQQEFRAAVDEPMKEVRETANLLRDSADFRALQDGDRAEKPKSAEMPAITAPSTRKGPAVVTGDARPPEPFSASQRSSAAAVEPAEPVQAAIEATSMDDTDPAHPSDAPADEAPADEGSTA